MTAWRLADVSHVRATIALACVGADSRELQLGDVVLRDHQREAATRLRVAIQKFGGALLADEVGLGKTYTALAAARDVTPLLVVAPAALTAMWQASLRSARVEAEVISLESLSRREPPRPRRNARGPAQRSAERRARQRHTRSYPSSRCRPCCRHCAQRTDRRRRGLRTAAPAARGCPSSSRWLPRASGTGRRRRGAGRGRQRTLPEPSRTSRCRISTSPAPDLPSPTSSDRLPQRLQRSRKERCRPQDPARRETPAGPSPVFHRYRTFQLPLVVRAAASMGAAA